MECLPSYQGFTVILLIVAYLNLYIVAQDADTNRKWFFDILF